MEKTPPTSNNHFNPWRALSTTLSIALLVATLFTLWTPANLFSNNLLDSMFAAIRQTQTPPVPGAGPAPANDSTPAAPAPRRIGLVSGHRGNDSGAVCADGLTEADLNFKIATMTRDILLQQGFEVDLLDEFDPRLQGYSALALVSIHNDSCEYYGDEATGFKVAAAMDTNFPEKASRLTACMSQRYQALTGMTFHANTVTNDMTEYHAFGEINTDTVAAIIETGFMNLDRDMLVNHTDVVAQGVADGILCYLRNENIPSTPTPAPAP